MKSLNMRSGAALLCAATLAACGGGGGNLTLGVTVTGLTRTGLVLLNGDDKLEVASSGTYYFPKMVATDEQFNITVKDNPSGVKCEPTSATSGKANAYTALQAVVSCTTIPYTLGGSINGLTANGLVLANGSSLSSPAAGSTSFSFGDKVANGAPYGVTVLSQPTGLTCSIDRPVGTMPQVDSPAAMTVTCRPN
jgi:hypothetical protein